MLPRDIGQIRCRRPFAAALLWRTGGSRRKLPEVKETDRQCDIILVFPQSISKTFNERSHFEREQAIAMHSLGLKAAPYGAGASVGSGHDHIL